MIPAVREYTAQLEREKLAALGSVAAAWARMSPDFDPSWKAIGPAVTAVTLAAQLEVARLANEYVPAVLATTAPGAAAAQYEPSLRAWQGTAGDGRPVETLAAGAVVQAKLGVQRGLTVPQALGSAGRWLDGAVSTVLADTHRGVEQMGAHSRRVERYVRMIVGRHTCGRCVILAGKIYRTAEAFDRHPECDCEHIPVAENVAGDLTTSPSDYLDSLDDDELAKALGSKANAEAYRDGADVNQLINAYRQRGDVRKAQMWGRSVSYTTEGMTKRGWAYKRMTGGRTQARLMPSSIYEIAKDRDDAIRLLRVYGWIL